MPLLNYKIAVHYTESEICWLTIDSCHCGKWKHYKTRQKLLQIWQNTQKIFGVWGIYNV